MLTKSSWSGFIHVSKTRAIVFTLLGVAGLMLKRHYAGPLGEVVHSYGGNFSVSFAVYFILLHLPFQTRSKTFLTAALALAVVELFEVFDGFGILTNVYDAFDFFANALGVAVALVVDTALNLHIAKRAKTQQGIAR